MSEERKMILQMLADGKITADEAETLLQAIEESERTAHETVVEGAQRTADGLHSLGQLIDRSVQIAVETMDQTLRSMEERLKHDGARQEQLRRRIAERIRRSTERALERALQAEERAARAAERAAARMARWDERLARREERKAELEEREAELDEQQAQLEELEAELEEREAEREEQEADREEREAGHSHKKTFFKMGIHIDKETVERTDHLTLATQPGDRFVLENRVGDIDIEFYDGQEIAVEARKTVWGSDEADANERADATGVRLVRSGPEVRVEVDRPTITAMGVIQLKDTRIDFKIRVPRLTHLQVSTKVGDIRVRGDDEVTTWFLASKVGDIDLTLPPEAGFTYALRTRVGKIDVDLRGGTSDATRAQGETEITGSYGEGRGRIDASAVTGDIRLHHEDGGAQRCPRKNG